MKNVKENGKGANYATPKTNVETETTVMNNSTLHHLFLEELRDMYWAEKFMVKSLPTLIKACTSNELKVALEGHLKETENHVTRLENVFQIIGENPSTKKCEAMQGLVDEAARLVEHTKKDTHVRDVAIISACQKIEHYEIASYGTLYTLAAVMEHSEAVEILKTTLGEEKNADVSLTHLAKSFINESAKIETK
jgi:ferritin-like metal-binding protein YciE